MKLLILLNLIATPVWSAPIAIVDSGTDLSHPSLTNVQWTNVKDEDDAVDNDDNGYIDDTHGWNFAESNNQLYDKRFLGKFSKDVYTYFEIQFKKLTGTATETEIQWMKDRLADLAFRAELGTFGNFVHGTHVAGIASIDSSKAQIMPLKLLPTKAPSQSFRSIRTNGMFDKILRAIKPETKKKLLLAALDFLGKQQGQTFAPISGYLKTQGAKVANCSFGTSATAVKSLLKPLLEAVFKRPMTPEELSEYANYLVNASQASAQAQFIQPAPDTLFVIAAGNDGADNDQVPASPTNIKADNTISVAATMGTQSLASFSNFGATMVDLAAPGVGIRSSVPGGETLVVSGTSQAAPAVANAAGQILDANPALTPAQVKQILMKTVDKKGFLKGKVVSEGLLNKKRAVTAAEFSVTRPLDEAIARAHRAVRADTDVAVMEEGGLLLPLPTVSYE